MSRLPGGRSRERAVLGALVACLCLPAAASAAGPPPPPPIPLADGWEITDTPIDPAAPTAASWRPASVPGVFDPDVSTSEYEGTAKQYRLYFLAPSVPGYRWALRFEQVRRAAAVYLNGRYIGGSLDPYSPFEMAATGLRPGVVNELIVTVDGRKDPRLMEGWWNWGGITRPVTLVPTGRVSFTKLGLLSDVECRGPARRCTADVLVDGVLSRLPAEPLLRGRPRSQPVLTVRLRSPGGRVTRAALPLTGWRGSRRRVRLPVRVPRPVLWAPERPALYDAVVSLSYRGRTEQVERMRIGLRSVTVKRGFLRVNNRRVQLRGASIHEDFPGRGAALTAAEMDTIVRELKELGANVTRSHYALSEGLLQRFDQAGIMVWNQAPNWQRDVGADLLRRPAERAFAVRQVAGTVRAGRNHPSVIVHSVGNELAFKADSRPGTRRFTNSARKVAEDLDPTLPVAIDIKGRAGYGEQFAYGAFDVIGINQYYGWYDHVPDFKLLEPFMREMRDHYPRQALVMTEFGAEGRPDMADEPADVKGSYGFQTKFVGDTMDVVDRLEFLSGAIHWTLREFEIYPGWRGGAVPGPGRNSRHHKGVLTYFGDRKPAWDVLREHFARTPPVPLRGAPGSRVGTAQLCLPGRV